MALTKTEARKIMLGVAGMFEKPYFAKPTVFYGEDFVGRAHDKEDAVVLRVGSIEMRDVMLEAEPRLFYITDHYKDWPFLLARLDRLDAKKLRALVAARKAEIDAAPKKQKRAPVRKKKKAR